MPFAPEDAPLAHLSEQVMVAAALDKALDGTALWVLLGLYRAYAVLDRDQAEEVACIGLSPLQFNILTVLQRTGQPTTMGALAGMLVVKPTNLSGNINTLIERGLVKRLERLMYGLSREKRIQLVSLLRELLVSIEDEQARDRAADKSEKKSRAA